MNEVKANVAHAQPGTEVIYAQPSNQMQPVNYGNDNANYGGHQVILNQPAHDPSKKYHPYKVFF
jgi:hypothetical protein